MIKRTSEASFQVLYRGSMLADGVSSRGGGWHPAGGLARMVQRVSVGDLVRGLGERGEVASFFVMSRSLVRLPTGGQTDIASLLGDDPELLDLARTTTPDWESLWRTARADQIASLAATFHADLGVVMDLTRDAIETALHGTLEVPAVVRKILRRAHDGPRTGQWQSASEDLLRLGKAARARPGMSLGHTSALSRLMLAVYEFAQIPTEEARGGSAPMGTAAFSASVVTGSALALVRSLWPELDRAGRAGGRQYLLLRRWAHTARTRLPLSELCLAVAQRHGRSL